MELLADTDMDRSKLVHAPSRWWGVADEEGEEGDGEDNCDGNEDDGNALDAPARARRPARTNGAIILLGFGNVERLNSQLGKRSVCLLILNSYGRPLYMSISLY